NAESTEICTRPAWLTKLSTYSRHSYKSGSVLSRHARTHVTQIRVGQTQTRVLTKRTAVNGSLSVVHQRRGIDSPEQSSAKRTRIPLSLHLQAKPLTQAL